MIRMIAIAAMFGASAATVALYAITRPSGTQLAATEEWPICSTMASVAQNADWAPLDPDFAAGKKAMAAGDWVGAIAVLKSAALRDPRNADIQNYIGYGYRRLRELEPAFAHFRQALTFNPRHRAAHQHMGETYLTIGNVAAAEEHLAALERICLIPCNEYGDLQKVIAKYKTSGTQ
jgi:tetratricopeptide (TPR) repeat protein